MKLKFRLFRRSTGIFFIEDRFTKKQESLRTRDAAIARRLAHAKNEAHEQPLLNIQIARTYLAAADPEMTKRTWSCVMEAIEKTKRGETLDRWMRATRDSAFEVIRDLPILETRSDHFSRVLESGTVSTNVFLRRLHNYALNMSWLPWPIMPKAEWPSVRYQPKRAISASEHAKIVNRERNPEWKAFYELLWHLGGSQSDVASISAEDIDWEGRTICYCRKKTVVPVLFRFSDSVANLLRQLTTSGPLFPRIAKIHEKHRAMVFRQRCRIVEVTGVTLHSYRYAWAERARKAGYPERFAQEALGHNSKAVHRAYARRAEVRIPSLEEFEKQCAGVNESASCSIQ